MSIRKFFASAAVLAALALPAGAAESISVLPEGAQIIDTRAEEYFIGWENSGGISGHIAGAIDFPVQWLDLAASRDRLDKELERRGIDRNAVTVLYGDGDTAPGTAEKFEEHGFTRIKTLKGGIAAYAAGGGKLERLPGYRFFVSPSWVASLMAGENPEGYDGRKYVIAEVSFAGDDKYGYKTGHIPGAVFLDPDVLNEVPGPREVPEYENIPMEIQRKIWGFPEPSVIKSVCSAAGIDKDTLVILYAPYAATTAAYRAALVLDYAGVEDIRIINGGKPLWKLEKRPMDTVVPVCSPVDFGCEVPAHPGIVYSIGEELDFINNGTAVIASVRSWPEYLCRVSGYTYIDEAGDIPCSRFAYAGSNPYAMEDFRNIDNTTFNYNIIADRWNLWGITPDRKISFHCGTGWRAAETYYIARAIGYKDCGVYVGGWYRWTKYPGLPVKPAGLPADAPETEPREYF